MGRHRIAPIFGNIPDEIKAARLRLARAITSVATEGSRSVDALKYRATGAMARDYRARWE